MFSRAGTRITGRRRCKCRCKCRCRCRCRCRCISIGVSVRIGVSGSIGVSNSASAGLSMISFFNECLLRNSAVTYSSKLFLTGLNGYSVYLRPLTSVFT